MVNLPEKIKKVVPIIKFRAITMIKKVEYFANEHANENSINKIRKF